MLNQRNVALEALIAVGNDYGYSNLVLSDILKKHNVPQQEKPFITALFYGVLDRVITLDYIISQFSSGSLKRIKPITLNALRIGLFQIVYMDKIPESAAVNESVKLVKNSKEKYSAAFVNALLRNFLRGGSVIPQDNSLNSLSVRYSCPVWIIESLINDYGNDTALQILEHYLTAPKITIRVNTLAVTDDELLRKLVSRGIDARRAEFAHAIVFNDGIDVTGLPEYKDGLFHIEDLPSQIAVSELALSAGNSLLDMCAAPGGKTFTAAENAGDAVSITACDVFEHRVNLIKAGAKRLKIKNVSALLKDSTVFDDTLGMFDAVICDVPCSGLGVIRRKPDIKYKSALDFEGLRNTQTAILTNGMKYLKPGGTLLYSTCTLRKDENENTVRACLADRDDFNIEHEHTFLPGIDGTDGFYYAILKRR